MRPNALALLLVSAVTTACGSAGGEARRHEPRPAPELSPEDRQRVNEALRMVARNDPGFPAVRDALAGRPDTAWWLARAFVVDAVLALDQGAVDDVAFLRAVAGQGNASLVRSLNHLKAMGAAAVPCVVEDLLEHPHTDRSELGVRILTSIGKDALPALESRLTHTEPRIRRHALEVVGGVGGPEVVPLLERGTRDPDFGVRASAYVGLARQGVAYLPRLHAALRSDPDPFVRRSVAKALAGFRDRGTAEALVAYLAECQSAKDGEGAAAADASLKRISGVRGTTHLESWRRWLATVPAGGVPARNE